MVTLEQLFRQRAKIDAKIRAKQRRKTKRHMNTRKKSKGVVSGLFKDIQRIRKERSEKRRQQRFNKARAIQRVRESELSEARKQEAIEGLRTTEESRFKANE